MSNKDVDLHPGADVQTQKSCADKEKQKRTAVTLTISKSLIVEAHDLGLNVSKVCENCLKEFIETIKEAKQHKQAQNYHVFGEAFSQKGSMAGGEGFEPSTPNLGGIKKASIDKIVIDWVSFRKYLEEKNYRRDYDKQVFSVAMRFHDFYLSNDLSKVKQLSPSMRSKVMGAFSALSQFQGRYEEFKQLIKNYGLTWTGRTADDLIIDRLNRTDDPEDVFSWIKNVKEACPEYALFMDFNALTGLRLSESINSFNLIAKLTKDNELATKYYNVKTGFLEHFRFKEIFLRDCKKAFLSYLPLEMLELIGKQNPISMNHLKNRSLSRKHIPQRFSDVRENFASFTTEWLRPEEIDFLQGRVTANVFQVHYYNPKLVHDLRFRAAQAAQAILLKVHSDLVLKREIQGERGGEKKNEEKN